MVVTRKATLSTPAVATATTARDAARAELALLTQRLAAAQEAPDVDEPSTEERDRLGRMKVTMAGLAERDRLVFGLCRAAGLPVAVVMAGGYAPAIEDIVRIHAETVRIAAGTSG